MKLPKRSRAHQLEELSIDKFKSLLPIEWIYRTPTHDYGIDGEVEIFDNDGYTTGKKFLVQLKATDEKDIDKASKLRMGIEKLNYYQQLEQPILIVRYMANTDDIYVRWFHSLNPNVDKISEKSFCMMFRSHHHWDDEKLDVISRELSAYFLFNNHPLQKPIDIEAITSNDSALSKYTARFVTRLMGSGKTSGLFTFTISSEKSNNPIYIELFDDEYHISLGGVASLRGSVTPPSNNDDLNTIVANINVSLAILLYKLEHNSESERLFYLFLPTSSSEISELTLTSYVGLKARTNKISDALDYLLSLSMKGGLLSNETVNIIQVTMARVTQLCTPDDESKVESTFLAIIDEAKNIDLGLASVFYYNLGNHLRARGENRYAIKQYIAAAKANPDYKLRFYWKKELAGLFFEIGKYRIASTLYESALSNDPTCEVRGLLADSLMFSGFFKRALAEFELTLSASEDGDPEWCLKYWCLEQIVNELGVESQVVGPSSGMEFIKECTEEDANNYLLTTNAICPDCWFFIATKLAERSDFDGATVCFLLSAFSDERHKESWMRSLQCSMRAKSSKIMHHIILVVSSKFGNEAICDFFETLDDDGSSRLNEMSLDVIKACEEFNSERRRKGFKLRLGDSIAQEVLEL